MSSYLSSDLPQKISSYLDHNKMWQQFEIIFLFLLLPSLLVLLLNNMIKKKSDKINLPPSPPKLPLIGNLRQLGSVPHRSLRALSDKYGPLMLLQLGRIPTLIVSSQEIAQEIFKTHDLIFASRPASKLGRLLFYGGADSTLAPYGERWIRAKKLCVTHLLSSKMVHSFRRIREEEAETMVAKIRRMSSLNLSGLVDLTEILSTYTADILSRGVSSSFFREESRNRELREIIKQIDSLFREFHLEDFFPVLRFLEIFDFVARAKRNARRMDVILEEVLEYHARKLEDADEAHKPTDFVDVLLSLEKEGGFDDFPFTRESMKTVLVDIFAAGSSATYFVLERSMTELLRNPKAMEKLQAEVRGIAGDDDGVVREEDLSRMSFLKAVIKEVLRLHPPDPLLIPRETIEDCQLAGYKIPKKTRVFINAWAIGRDPKCWEEPEEFKPERFVDSSMDFKGSDSQFFPFGAGRRNCPGINFAVQTIELALANLVNRFDWEVPGDMKREDLYMNDVPGAATGGIDRLELVAKLFSF